VVQIEPVEDASGLPELPGRSEIETFTGGARVGWASASWPLAKLRISRGELVLSIGMLGEYRFKPGDVVAVEQVGVVPIIGRGVRIEHRREDVAERVIFYSWGSPRRILDALERCGFQPSADPHDMPVSRGWPLRIPFVVGAGILWNLLFLIDRPWERASDGEFVWGPGIFAALGLVFLGTQLIRTWTPLQRVALNGPRALERIEGPRKLLAFVSGTMLVLGGIAALLASSSSPSVDSGSAADEASGSSVTIGPEQVPDEWDFYLAQVDDAPAVVRVNFWFQSEAPIRSAPHLHWVAVQMLDPGEHGMGTEAEGALLWGVEDRIAEEAKKVGLYFVGRLRNDGRWQLVFYGPQDMTERLTEITAGASGTRKYVVDGKEDEDWSYYGDFLLPDAERAAWIENRRVVDQLEVEGDSLKVPRRVDHWAYFATRYGRDAFVGEVRSKGFDVEQKSDTNALGDASALQFGVQIYRVDSVALEDIHGVVMELSKLASTFEGDYDGWETQVVTEAK